MYADLLDFRAIVDLTDSYEMIQKAVPTYMSSYV